MNNKTIQPLSHLLVAYLVVIHVCKCSLYFFLTFITTVVYLLTDIGALCVS